MPLTLLLSLTLHRKLRGGSSRRTGMRICD
jgi:hypothetical protein